jgi:hypothetical protein
MREYRANEKAEKTDPEKPPRAKRAYTKSGQYSKQNEIAQPAGKQSKKGKG